MKALHTVAFILVIVGALNWLLVGINSSWNLVALVFGTSVIANIVYILVGISGIILVATHKKSCKDCCAPSSNGGTM